MIRGGAGELHEDLLELGRWRRDERNLSTFTHGMGEGQPPPVKRGATHPRVSSPVERVSNQRHSGERELGPYLVLAARLETHLEQRPPPVISQALEA